MTAIVMSCVTNYENDPDLGEHFEGEFELVKGEVEALAGTIPHKGDVDTLFIQMQFDCEGMPNAVSGFKIGRYSAKHRDLQCVVEVPYDAYLAQSERRSYLLSRVRDLLSEIETRLRGKTPNNVAEIISVLENRFLGG